MWNRMAHVRNITKLTFHNKFDVHVTVHHAKFLIVKPTRCTAFSNLFLGWNSTCFGQFLCPSSGVFHCTHSNGICHTGLLTACEQDQDGTAVHLVGFIIRNLTRCTVTWTSNLSMPDRQKKYISIRTPKKNCMKPMWQYGITKYASSSILILFASCQQTCMTYTIAACTVKNSWRWTEELSETCRVSFQE